jgi:hypothetical protein
LRYNDDVTTNDNSWLNANASHVSTDSEISLDTTRYVLTIEEASRLFAEGGVPRSPRTITRFCQLGDLDCLRVETEKNFKYLIDRNSVEERIKQLQQALQFSNKTSPDMSSHVETNNETQPDMSRQAEQARETPARDEEAEYLAKRVEELENENIHLKISKAANEQVINQLHGERKEYITQMQSMSFQLGEATAKLQLLDAPRPEPEARHVETEPVEQVSDAVEVLSEPAPAPTPQAAPAAAEPMPEKRGFFDRLLGR